MSLYSKEEICEGCVYGIFHKCCNKFCKCSQNHENDANPMSGRCKFKKKGKMITIEDRDLISDKKFIEYSHYLFQNHGSKEQLEFIVLVKSGMNLHEAFSKIKGD